MGWNDLDLVPARARCGTLTYSACGPVGADQAGTPRLTYDEAHDDLPQARRVAGHDPRVLQRRARPACGGPRRLGQALLPDMVAAGAPALARIPGQERVPTRELWLLVHSDARPLRRAQVVAARIAGLCRTLDQSAPRAK